MWKTKRVAVALGSNEGDRLSNLRLATEKLRHLADPEEPFLSSSVYETQPVLCPPGSAPFFNAVVEFASHEKPVVLLERLQRIESLLGRPASRKKNAPRTLDLDLLYVGDIIRNDQPPVLPHPLMAEREFVLAPLAEIAPTHLLDGQTIAEHLARLEQSAVRLQEPLASPVDARLFASKLIRTRKNGVPLTALTAYDYPGARILDEAGVDIILVGDSVGMVVLGYPDTTRVKLADIVHHLRAARRGTVNALLVADLPFETYRTPAHALSSALELIDSGADAVKLEGGEEMTGQIEMLCEHDIPVMAHIGMLPQHVLEEGGYHIKGRTPDEAARLVASAKAVQEAGAFAVVLEIVEHSTAALVRSAVEIPTIGIGSGTACDGQILVTHDLVGLYPWFTPPFARPEADLAIEATAAVKAFIRRTQARQ